MGWVLTYLACVSIAILLGGALINERVERLVWTSMLSAELEHFRERSRNDADYQWTDTGGTRLFLPNQRPWPPELQSLPPGLHDDIPVAGKLSVVLVEDGERGRLALVEDVSEFNRYDDSILALIVGATAFVLLILGLALAWALGRATRPLQRIADDIAGLRPDQPRQRISMLRHNSRELWQISEKFNEYLDRNEAFIERERTFINSASHELRTPVTVMIGASELALAQTDLSARSRGHMQRVLSTAREMDDLIGMLLMLGKDPARVGRMSDQIALDQLLPEIVKQHLHLTRDKQLTVTIAPLPACDIIAPHAFVQAAIGNLLRNAIENSDSGEIIVSLLANATVIIDDPGHGMSPDQISRIYSRMARGEPMPGDGIGLELITRLSDHLGWKLEFSARHPRGTRASLRFSA
ncbi:sensor histidine kinase [Pseudoxanthomonas dokdonensis]|nr:HAMP domain-containing sensor histidine kinase [Pseudoxanthomonas dokdonensis]